MSKNHELTYDDMIQRYIAAFDEIQYIAQQFAVRMGMAHEHDNAKDYLEAIMAKADDLVMELEQIYGDACPE